MMQTQSDTAAANPSRRDDAELTDHELDQVAGGLQPKLPPPKDCPTAVE